MYKSLQARLLKIYSKENARDYRAGDDLHRGTDHHAHICRRLQSIAQSFDHEISALDIGCGSGRYFHCLRNTAQLTAIDISPSMIEEAKNPILKNEITVKNIALTRGNFFEMRLDPGSFDFIYSVGVLGEYSPFNSLVCAKAHSLLAENGTFFFTVVDRESKEPFKSAKRKIAEKLARFLPPPFRAILHKRLLSKFCSWHELETIMNASPFSSFEISRYTHNSAYWHGAHLECRAQKIAGFEKPAAR